MAEAALVLQFFVTFQELHSKTSFRISHLKKSESTFKGLTNWPKFERNSKNISSSISPH